METSSKDGRNILDSLVMLAREMCASEDVEVTTVCSVFCLFVCSLVWIPSGANISLEDPGWFCKEELLFFVVKTFKYSLTNSFKTTVLVATQNPFSCLNKELLFCDIKSSSTYFRMIKYDQLMHLTKSTKRNYKAKLEPKIWPDVEAWRLATTSNQWSTNLCFPGRWRTYV